jgi:hypothetical protein
MSRSTGGRRQTGRHRRRVIFHKRICRVGLGERGAHSDACMDKAIALAWNAAGGCEAYRRAGAAGASAF